MKIKRNMPKTDNERGNAMVYVLVALALLGFLTLTLSRQNDQADGQDLDDEMVDLYANELINYAAAAQNSVDMMLASGSEIDDLNFVIPSDASFNTPPHYNKVFHPLGGGLNYQEKYASNIGLRNIAGAWYYQNNLNVEWTPTTSTDVILMAHNINIKVCEGINEKILGSKTIPSTSVGLNAIFKPDSYTESSFNNSNCPACNEYPALCVSNNVQDTYGFYSIIAAQ